MHILGISGSLRRNSFNSGLLRAAVDLMPAGTVFDEAGMLKDEKVRAQLRDFVQGFVQFVSALRSPKSPSSA
jgi:NAD(P)H-dependent FMN reductase